MIEVTPGIYQLPLPMINPSSGHVNAYLVQGDNEYLLIDTGWNTEEAFDSLKKQLAENDIKFKDIRQIVVTHVHPDHYGLAGRLKQLSGATLAI
ncbi:MAG: MBL fold metallo-hydrolase, partial [Dehalococcoidia bacterium]|nr:MBL fold metallo-hydrolase [Dehalococcoidia bacterium]